MTIFRMATAGAEVAAQGVLLTHGAPRFTEIRWSGLPANFVAEVSLAALCRSDLKEAAGHRPVRSDFGHEIVLTVLQAPFASGLSPGDRVVLDPHVPLCRSTGFANYLFARGSADQISKAFVRIPDALDNELAVFIEPLACAMHAAAILERHSGRDVVGMDVCFTAAGIASVLQAKILRSRGANVTLFNPSPERLDYLSKRGVLDDGICAAKGAASANTCDAVIVSGIYSDESSLRMALHMVRPNGTILLFGGTHPDKRFGELDIDAIRRNQTLLKMVIDGKMVNLGGTYGATTLDFFAGMGFVLANLHHLNLGQLIEERVKLHELPRLICDINDGARKLSGKIIVETKH